MDKTFITANQLLEDSFKLAAQVLTSGFRPTYIVGVWRGGSPIGIAVQELLDYCGVNTDHIAIRTSVYKGIDEASREVQVYGLGYLADTLNAQDALLIVDDVFDSGRSIDAIIDELTARCRRNTPHDIRVATVYDKPDRHIGNRKPDFFLHATADWLVFPHEMKGLTKAEIKQYKPAATAALETLAVKPSEVP